MAGTAYGDIATDEESLRDPPPPNGTIFDRLHAYGISWRNYFTDLPQTAIIPSIIEKYPANLPRSRSSSPTAPPGRCPSVSFVDPEFGALSDIGAPLAERAGARSASAPSSQTTGGDEENPQDMSYGEYWAYQVVNAVLHSPAWPRTLLIYTYDEHGGYYDHVPPPAAIAPDSIPPELGPEDVPGGYDLYGPRVPGIVASPYSKPNAMTNVVHDHTSVLATIEAKWNLPALTYRDANANTVDGLPRPPSAPRCSNRRDRPPLAEPPEPVATRRGSPSTRAPVAVPCSRSRSRLAPSAAHARQRARTAAPARAQRRYKAFAAAGQSHLRDHARERETTRPPSANPPRTPIWRRRCPPRARCSRTTTPPATRATTTTSRSSPASRRTPTTRPTARSSTNFLAAAINSERRRGRRRLRLPRPSRRTSARSCRRPAGSGRPTSRTWATTPTARPPPAGTRR